MLQLYRTSANNSMCMHEYTTIIKLTLALNNKEVHDTPVTFLHDTYDLSILFIYDYNIKEYVKVFHDSSICMFSS